MGVLKDLRSLTNEELTEWLIQHGEKKFRAQQVQEWLWKKGATDFDQMSNLSVDLRTLLNENFSFPNAVRKSEQIDRKSVV